MGGPEFKVSLVSTSAVFPLPSSIICVQVLSRCSAVLNLDWSFTRQMERKQWF